MKNFKRHPITLFFVVAVMVMGCNSAPDLPPRTLYSFFVAGHAYGKPGVNNVGLHPPFVDQFEVINQAPQMEFGVLTGDVVKDGSHAEFQEVTDQLNAKLDVPVHIAPGNHDLGDLAAYTSYYGPTFSAFTHEGDLFILLDPNEAQWSIRGKQLGFLKESLETHRFAVNHVFVFFHQMLWWEPNNQFQNIVPNSEAGRVTPTNFSTEVLPMLENLPIPVVCFAGDIGAHWNHPAVMYYTNGQMTYIASGMGGEVEDNFVIAHVMGDGTIQYELIGLNCPTGTQCLGALEDHFP